MPEGHTIHRVARDHSKRYVGQSLTVMSPQGRFRAGARQLDGATLEQVEAYGKHLFYRWEGERLVHIHLGLYGKFRNHRCPPPEPRGAVRLRVIGEGHAFDLNGPTACELISPVQRDKILARLGADPLRKVADVEAAWQRINHSRAAIGKLLLDQSVIAGVGRHPQVDLADARLRARAEQIIRTEIDFMSNREFAAEALETRETIEEVISADCGAAPADLPPHLRRLCSTELLTQEEEATLFREMNLLKFQANVLRSRLDPANATEEHLLAIESRLGQAQAILDHIRKKLALLAMQRSGHSSRRIVSPPRR